MAIKTAPDQIDPHSWDASMLSPRFVAPFNFDISGERVRILLELHDEKSIPIHHQRDSYATLYEGRISQ
jgi:hypothetical protein